MKVIYSHALMMQHFQNSLEWFLKGHVMKLDKIDKFSSAVLERKDALLRDYFILFSIRCRLSNVDVSRLSITKSNQLA